VSSFSAQAVPEPSSLALVAFGGLLARAGRLALRRRRRNARMAA
jgi:hypothetical protein